MILLFSSVGLWRQQLRPEARVHGIIKEGGTAANIIPERTKAWFMLRSPEQAEYERMKARFRAMAEAAAMATGTSVEIAFSGGATSTKPNLGLEARWIANAEAYGIVDQGPDPNSGSTDMANVSWVCPTIHPDLAIADEGTPGHSILFRDAAATPRADETTLLAATLVAQTAYELFADPALVESVWQEFKSES
jgi:metal-dependent amidase/aminoacylase/carboxypeptidase family protein